MSVFPSLELSLLIGHKYVLWSSGCVDPPCFFRTSHKKAPIYCGIALYSGQLVQITGSHSNILMEDPWQPMCGFPEALCFPNTRTSHHCSSYTSDNSFFAVENRKKNALLVITETFPLDHWWSLKCTLCYKWILS